MILGIDPGTLVVGYGAVVDHVRGPRLYAAGVVRAASGTSVPERLGRIRSELDGLLERLRPAVVVVEEAFFGNNVQSALRIGEGRGVALSCAAAAATEVVQYPPSVAKKKVCGNGRATKVQVAAMVERLLGDGAKGLPLDASDALALALAHVQERAWAGRLTPRP